MTRRHLALGALALLVLLAGCSVGPQEIPAKDLTGEATYDWDTNASVTYNITSNQYTAIYNVTNQTTLEVFGRSTLGGDQPLDVSALRFRFRNGTVVNANHSGLSVVRESDFTNVSLPAREGKLAFANDRNGKEFRSPVFLEGSWEVTLPAAARVGVPFLSAVSPGNYNRSYDNNRVTIRWGNVTAGSVHARWYMQLDLFLFTTIVIAGLGLGIGGAVYYLRQIRRLERRRKEMGIDVEEEDQDDPRDSGPPPGMR
jgi:hypothetical protein